jgi:hypothetical protein
MSVSRADRFTQQDRKTQIYSDFLSNLNPHPVAKDIVKYVNEQAVAKSIRNLMLTNRRERFFQPDLGSNIRSLLFEPMGSDTAQLIISFIRQTLENYEPRAKILNIQAVPDYDNNLYQVKVVFMVINKQEPVTVDVTLDRVR